MGPFSSIRAPFGGSLLRYRNHYELMATINSNLITVLKDVKGAAPQVLVLQRHYPTRSSPAIVDADLQFDLRTAFPSDRSKGKVKVQGEWLQATYEALSNKRSNLEVIVGAVFPYQQCPMCKGPEIVDYVAKGWIACKPLVDVMLKGSWK